MAAGRAMLWRVMAMFSLLSCLSAGKRDLRGEFQSRLGRERNRLFSLEVRGASLGTGHDSITGVGGVRKLFQDDVNATESLWNAVNANSTEDVRLALANDPDVNAKLGTENACPCTALIIAADVGNLEIVELLIESGADLEATTANGGATALFAASQMNHVDVVRALLDAGADVDTSRDGGATPLIVAAEDGHLDVVEVLIESGANITKPDNNRKTALHASVLTIGDDSVKIATVLLDAGADINALDTDRSTPLMWATFFGNYGVAKLLVEMGADTSLRDNFGLDAASQICSCPPAAGAAPGALTCPVGGCEIPETMTMILETLSA